MKKIPLILISCFFLSFTPEDKIKTILEKVNKVYSESNISFEFEMYYVSSQNTKEEYEKGIIQLTPNSYYSKKNNIHRFYDKNFAIAVDSKYKLMEVSEKNSEKKLSQKQQELTSNWQNNTQIKLKEIKSHFVITQPEMGYIQSYFINKNNYTLEKIVYEFSDDTETPQFIVNYINIKTHQDKNEIISSPNYFFKLKRKQMIGINEFKGFTIKTK